MNSPLVSIVIPARNAQATIKKCIDSILQQSYRNYELIIINDGSTDKTAQILAGYPQAKILITPGTGPSKARNTGIAQAKGEFVAFTDADCVVDYHWIEELLKGFINERIAGVGGIQKSPADDSCFGRKVHEFLATFGFISDYIRTSHQIRPVNHNPSCNVIYRKSVLTELTGFLEDLWPGEDVELDYRIRKKGYLLMFNPKAAVFHYRPNNLRDFSRMMFRYGRAQGWLVKKYGFFRRIHLVPVFILLLSLLFLWNTIFGLSVFILTVAVIFIRLLMKTNSPFLMSWLFFETIFAWNLGFLSGLAKRKLI